MRESVIGNLKPGYLADLMVLDKDYFSVPEKQIHDIKVLMTLLGGRITWVEKSFATGLLESYEKLMHPTFVEFREQLQGL